jgi:cell division protein FtsQ
MSWLDGFLRGRGLTRVERAAEHRRRRARAHLERLRSGRTPRERTARPRPLRAGALVLVVSGLLGLWLSAGWGARRSVASVSVYGARHLTPADVAAASGLARGAALASVDAGQVAAALSRHPWIAEARALVLPTGGVVVSIREREPAAVLAGMAVDGEGVPFAPAPASGLEQLPQLSASVAFEPGRRHPELAAAVALARRLPERGLPAPLEVGISAADDPEGLWLRLPGLAPRVVLGREDLEARLGDLAELLEADLPELAHAAKLDLRFRDQAVLDQAAAPSGGAAPSEQRPTG